MKQAKIATQAKSRGRPASFCRDELVKTVMDLFWERGYQALSFNEIASATGLTRASLYNAFKTKEALFLECMRLYNANSPLALVETCAEGEPVGPLLFEVFDRICAERAKDTQNRGCLAANTFSELAASGTRLGAKVKAAQARKTANLSRLMRQAVRQGELPEDTDAETTAQVILAFMSGLSARSKTGATRHKLNKMSRLFLHNIGFARAP